MIPAKIHFCWFGGKPMPQNIKEYIQTWKKYCPNYEIQRWDETNYDIHKNQYTEQAYKNQKWAFLTDYVRLDVVYQQGGIYLDTDVELIRGLDSLRENKCYMGMEQIGKVNTGLGFGAEAHHPFLLKNMQVYENANFVQKDGSFKPPTCVSITTKLLEADGLEKVDKIQSVKGVTIYPVDYLCPMKMGTNKIRITANTYSIHHYEASWYTGSPAIRRIKYYMIPAKIFVKKYILGRRE